MLSKVQLLQFIEECQKLPLTFSASLDERKIYWMRLEAEVGFVFFKNLAEQSDFENEQEAIEQLIRRYFAERGTLFGEKSSIAYLNHPFAPINQLCLRIAQVIAKPEESVWTILMPSVQKLCRSLVFSFKEDTEEEGHFPLELYGLNQTQTQLIPVAEIFSRAKVNTNALFPDFQQDLTALQYTLGGRDFLTLEQIAGEAGFRYMRALKQKHNRQFDDQSIGFAISKLIRELKRGASGDAGTELVADNEVLASPIQTFYTLWRSLPENIRAQVAPLKLKHYGYANVTLECYFITLFARCLGCELTDEEVLLQKEADIFPCANQISDSLDEYLTQHAQLYIIKINEQETEVQEHSDLKLLRDEALKALKTRGQSMGLDDDQLWYKLVQLMTFLDYSVSAIAQVIAGEIRKMQDLLSLIPINPQLFTAILDCLQERLGQLSFNEKKTCKVLLHFSAEKQQIIIQAKSTAIAELIRAEPEQYDLIHQVLKPELWDDFEQNYLQAMCDGIKSGGDCVFLMSELNETAVVAMLTYLQPRLHELFNNFDFAKLFTYRVKVQQKLLIDALFEQLIQWFSPNIYSRWDRYWEWDSKVYFLNRYLNGRTDVTGFDELLKMLVQWERRALMHAAMLDHFKPQLKMWITNSRRLELLIQNVYIKSNTLHEFSSLIDDSALFCRWLDFHPSALRSKAIFAVDFSQFIRSFSEFHTLASRLEKAEEQMVIERLGNTVTCTPDELTQVIANTTSGFIRALEDYLREYRNCGAVRVVNNLLKKLHNPEVSLAELIKFFQYEKKMIGSEYVGSSFFFLTARNSRLHTLLEQFVNESQELLDVVLRFIPNDGLLQGNMLELPDNIKAFIE
ncbi:MAG: hypothetical protein LEGION0403_FIIPPAGN_01661 [Legionella sp.]|uniref:hypothetical protein n=1 Tax=Legionella sp. TaxID=459 RepID=UPI003D125F8A